MVAVWVCRECGSDWATPKAGCIDCGSKDVDASHRGPEPGEPPGWVRIAATSPAVAIAALIHGRPCPSCKKRVAKWANVCRRCQHELTPPNNYAWRR